MINMPEPGSYVPAHFHDIDQFQIVLKGDGFFGKKPWFPGAFEYADAYAPYGLIHAGDHGISFLTLRVASSSGQYEMPGSRHLVPGPLGRRGGDSFDVKTPLPFEGEPPIRETLLERADGLLAVGMRLAPRGVAAGVEFTGGGQYYVICTGDLLADGRTLPACSLIRIERGEPVPELRAGPNGAVVVMLQFPRPTERLGSNPEALSARDYSIAYEIAGARN